MKFPNLTTSNISTKLNKNTTDKTKKKKRFLKRQIIHRKIQKYHCLAIEGTHRSFLKRHSKPTLIFSTYISPSFQTNPSNPRKKKKKNLKTVCAVKRRRCQHRHPQRWHLGSGSTPRTKSLSYTTLNARFAANPFESMLFPRSTSTKASLGTSQVISCTSLSVGSLFLFRLRLYLYVFIKLPVHVFY